VAPDELANEIGYRIRHWGEAIQKLKKKPFDVGFQVAFLSVTRPRLSTVSTNQVTSTIDKLLAISYVFFFGH
jgi:hypothetical protein